jgi:hypothetical protein
MSPKPDPLEHELFQFAQDLGETRDAPEEEPAVDAWAAAPKEVHTEAPEDTFQKALDELTVILRQYQDTNSWPKWQEAWWKQREKVLKSYGMTVDGFYDQLRKRSETKRT